MQYVLKNQAEHALRKLLINFLPALQSTKRTKLLKNLIAYSQRQALRLFVGLLTGVFIPILHFFDCYSWRW